MPKQYRRSVPLTKEQNEWFDFHPEINFAGFTRMAIQTFMNSYNSPKSESTSKPVVNFGDETYEAE